MDNGIPDAADWRLPATLDDWRQRFELGEELVVVQALYRCCLDKIAPPAWLADAYMHAVESVLFWHEHRSWDEVFGAPHDSNEKLGAARKKMLYQSSVYRRIRELMANGHKQDAAFNLTAQTYGLSRAKVQRFYLHELRFITACLGPQPLSPCKRPRRARQVQNFSKF